MARIDLLGVPMDLGAGRRGVDMGPSALRLARLGDTLLELGHQVVDHGNLAVPVAETIAPTAAAAPRGVASVPPRFLPAIAEVCTALAERIAAWPPGGVPLVLGGDHALSMGSLAGVRRRAPEGSRIGVLWVDAHADLHTPGSSPSGNVHGMPLAHLLGYGDPRLIEAAGGGRMDMGELAYIGLRSVDPAERAFILEQGVHAFTMSEVDRRGLAAVAEEALAALGPVDQLHLSFDVDVLDPSVAPGVGTPVPGGLSYREAHLLMEMLCATGKVASVDVVEVNPILDERNRSAGLAVELLASLFGRAIL